MNTLQLIEKLIVILNLLGFNYEPNEIDIKYRFINVSKTVENSMAAKMAVLMIARYFGENLEYGIEIGRTKQQLYKCIGGGLISTERKDKKTIPYWEIALFTSQTVFATVRFEFE